MTNNFQIPPQLIQMMKGGGSPQQILSSMLNGRNDGVSQNILNMMNTNNGNGIETLARNLCKSRGIDPDELMKNVQNQLK